LGINTGSPFLHLFLNYFTLKRQSRKKGLNVEINKLYQLAMD